MRNIIKLMTVAFLTVILLAACGGNNNEAANEETNQNKDTGNSNGEIQVVTSFTLIEDMVREIGGDKVELRNLVPIGTDPHEYDPLPDDIKAATDADVLFYNGFNLEGGDHGWFTNMMNSVEQDWDVAFELTEGVEPLYFTNEDGKDEEINPHAFLDPTVGIQMAENTLDALIEVDPNNKEYYEENADQYLTALKNMDEQYHERINDIPEGDRILITSERAYQYIAKRYGLTEGYIWAIDTEENGSPEQITSIIEFIEEKQPPVLFLETNVDPRPMETVSSETGIEIYGEVFSDEIGKPGEEGDTYLKFLQYNIDMIYDGLTSN